VYFEGVVWREESNRRVNVWVVQDFGRDLVQRPRSPSRCGNYDTLAIGYFTCI
jgi:hypothetical protein